MKRLLIMLAMVTAAAPAASAEPERMIAFGDSITRGLGDDGATCFSTDAGYPPRLRDALATQGRDATFINAGACGETTAEGVTRIDAVLAEHPDATAVILMEGTNDLSGFVSLESMRFNVSEMARKSEEAGMTPIILSVVPRGPDSGHDNDNTRTAFFAGWLAYDAEIAGRLFGDPFNHMFGFPFLFEQLYADPWHPNRRGYDLMAPSILEPALAAMEPPPPPFGLSCETESGEPAFPPGPCDAEPDDDTVLCLRDDRFRLDVAWQDFAGDQGAGHRMPLTSDTGTFYFFDPHNTELIVKVLDGSGANGHFWVFYGALSNVRYSLRVVDTETGGCKVYDNPEGAFASVGDTHAFLGDPEPAEPVETVETAAVEPSGEPVSTDRSRSAALAEPVGCVPDDAALCLQDGRFRVTVDWQIDEEQLGPGATIPLSEDTGAFYFFRETNIELVVKVLDGTSANGHFWVFYGALTNLAYTLTVTDTEDGRARVYENPRGTFASIGDTQAFPALPAVP